MSKEFTGKEACIAPEGVFIIGTYAEKGVPNAMNAAWGSQSDFDEITLFLDKHKTTDNVKKTGDLYRCLCDQRYDGPGRLFRRRNGEPRQ